ncbi:hypothetical protein BDR05DRAFT_1057967 [Suillus weaverae]|nr:hypothetical protein BDR05DRAFT_1057967 [Suillus weaverae]
MPDELLVECSIHLDAVPLKDVRSFKCGESYPLIKLSLSDQSMYANVQSNRR